MVGYLVDEVCFCVFCFFVGKIFFEVEDFEVELELLFIYNYGFLVFLPCNYLIKRLIRGP